MNGRRSYFLLVDFINVVLVAVLLTKCLLTYKYFLKGFLFAIYTLPKPNWPLLEVPKARTSPASVRTNV